MKNLTSTQVQEVKQLQPWSLTGLHGNTKRVGSLPINEVRLILEKRAKRNVYKHSSTMRKSAVQIVRELLRTSDLYKGTPYAKVMVEGNTGIYLASEVYGHSDYNKKRLFNKNDQTIRLMQIFNKLVNC